MYRLAVSFVVAATLVGSSMGTVCSTHNNNQAACRDATENNAQCYFYASASASTTDGRCLTYASAHCDNQLNYDDCLVIPGCAWALDSCGGDPWAEGEECGARNDDGKSLCACFPFYAPDLRVEEKPRGVCNKHCLMASIMSASKCRAMVLGGNQCQAFSFELAALLKKLEAEGMLDDDDTIDINGVEDFDDAFPFLCLPENITCSDLAALFPPGVCGGVSGCKLSNGTCTGMPQIHKPRVLSLAVILGIAVGGSIALLATVGGILYYVRARRSQTTGIAWTAGRPVGRIWSTADGSVVYSPVEDDDDRTL
jgi:hypothetical protein